MRKVLPIWILIITWGCGDNEEQFSDEIASWKDSEFSGDSLTGELTTKRGYIDSMALFISEKAFRKIALKRKQAMHRGQLMSLANDWVKAKIAYRGDTLPAKVRLKGDLGDHWAPEEHWSFKIELQKGRTIMGMKRFALQMPYTRGYLNEWVLHELLEYNGLIGLNYDFVKFSLNGKPFPVYAVEENFDKLLVTGNEKREGITFRFDRGFLWHQDPGINDALFSTLIRPYQNDKTRRNPLLSDQFYVVRNLIEQFRLGNLKTHEVFDSEKLAMSFAILDLTGHHHASSLDDIKFYYNPITSLIEPLIYDNAAFLDIKEQGLLGEYKPLNQSYEVNVHNFTRSYWYQYVLSDSVFFNHYVQALDKISKKPHLEKFFDQATDVMNLKLAALHHSYPNYRFVGKDILFNNQAHIRSLLNPMKALTVEKSGSKNILVSSLSLPIVIHSIMKDGKGKLSAPIIVQPRQEGDSSSTVRWSSIGELKSGDKVILKYQVLGSSMVTEEEVEIVTSTQNVMPSNTDSKDEFALSSLAKMSASEINERYDLKGLAKFFAVLDLLGSDDPAHLHTLSLLPLPLTGLLTPAALHLKSIGLNALEYSIPSYEIYGAKMISSSSSNQGFTSECRRLFGNSEFYKQYVKALEEVSMNGFFEKSDGDLVYKSMRTYYQAAPASKREILYKNQNFLRRYLNPVKAVHVHFERVDLEGGKLFLRISNAHKLPIEILEVRSYADWIFHPVANNTVAGSKEAEPMEYELMEFELPDRFPISYRKLGSLDLIYPWSSSHLLDLELHFKFVGASRSHLEKTIYPFQRFDDTFLENDLIRAKPNFKNEPSLSIDDAQGTIIMKKGDWSIKHDIKIPEGYTIRIEAGTSIDLQNGALILSNSPVIAHGTERKPIHFYSSDLTGQGLTLISVSDTSSLRFVQFSNMGNPAKNGWQLSGSLNLYESPIAIDNCNFKDNHSEDAVNIISSAYRINNSEFINISTDALDLDFSHGSVSNCKFQQVGNDAIDVSGGGINLLQNIIISGVEDKGISAGENCKLKCENISISNSAIGLAIKDGAQLLIDSLSIENCDVGFALFKKKSEYGSFYCKVEHLEAKSLPLLYLMENNGILRINGEPKAPNRENVIQLMYGRTYGKTSHAPPSVK